MSRNITNDSICDRAPGGRESLHSPNAIAGRSIHVVASKGLTAMIPTLTGPSQEQNTRKNGNNLRDAQLMSLADRKRD
jgi:hypothetical protein